jgi:hypothetical protein
VKAAGQCIVKAKPGDVWRLYTLADVHLGNIGCAEEVFRRYVKRIRSDPRGLWIGIGDYIDAISYRDRRFDADALPLWIQPPDLAKLGARLFAYFAECVKPIIHKCVGLAFGNHEWQLMHDTDSQDRWTSLIESLGVRDLGIAALMDLVFDLGDRHREKFRIGVHHGRGAAMTPGGKLNSMRQFAVETFPHCHIMISGHIHEALDTDVCGVDADDKCEHIVDCTRLAVSAGTFLRTYTQDHVGWGERKGFRPTSLGNTVIVIDPATRSLGTERPR